MSLQSLAFESLGEFTIQDVLNTKKKINTPKISANESIEFLLKELEMYPQIPIQDRYVLTIKDILIHYAKTGSLKGKISDLYVEGSHEEIRPWCLKPENSIYVLISLFSGSDFKHSCIIGDSVLTQKDLLKFLYIQSKTNQNIKKLFQNKSRSAARKHQDLKPDLKILSLDNTIWEGIQELTQCGFGAMPIEDVKMKQFTTRTLGYLQESYENLQTRKLKEIQLSELNVIDSNKTISEAIEIMLEEGYRRVWMEDPLDVLTMTDIISLLYKE
jgi:CBS domain-containing protein